MSICNYQCFECVFYDCINDESEASFRKHAKEMGVDIFRNVRFKQTKEDEKNRAPQRKYYEKHKEKAQAYQREYYAKHREETKAYKKKYYERCKAEGSLKCVKQIMELC